MTAETSAPEARPDRPTPLLVGAALAALEGAALVGWGLYDLIAGLVGNPINRGLTEFGAVVILLLGLMPLLAGWGLLRLNRWGRTPAVLTDTIGLWVAYYLWQSGGVGIALAVVVVAASVVGLVCLLNPRVTAALYRN